MPSALARNVKCRGFAFVILVADQEHVAPCLDPVEDVQPLIRVALNHLEIGVDPRVRGEYLLDLPHGRVAREKIANGHRRGWSCKPQSARAP